LKIAPDIHVASQVMDGYPPFWGNLHNGPILLKVDSVEPVVIDQIKKGYEFIKVYNRLDAAVYKKIESVCSAQNIKLAGHIPVKLDKSDMLTGQTGEIEHLSGYARLTSNIDTVSANVISQNSDLAYDLELAKSYSLDKIKIAAGKTRDLNIWNCRR